MKFLSEEVCPRIKLSQDIIEETSKFVESTLDDWIKKDPSFWKKIYSKLNINRKEFDFSNTSHAEAYYTHRHEVYERKRFALCCEAAVNIFRGVDWRMLKLFNNPKELAGPDGFLNSDYVGYDYYKNGYDPSLISYDVKMRPPNKLTLHINTFNFNKQGCRGDHYFYTSRYKLYVLTCFVPKRIAERTVALIGYAVREEVLAAEFEGGFYRISYLDLHPMKYFREDSYNSEEALRSFLRNLL